MQAVPALPATSPATPALLRLAVLALQHVLVMYAGAVAVAMLAVILALLRYGTGFLRNTAVLVGIVVGYAITLALGTVTGAPVGPRDAARGPCADGLGTVIRGVFNTFPYISFSQNVGLVGMMGVTSPMVCVAGGTIMILLATIAAVALTAFFNGAAADAPAPVSDHIQGASPCRSSATPTASAASA